MDINKVSLHSKYQILFVILNLFLVLFFSIATVLTITYSNLFTTWTFIVVLLFCMLIIIALILNLKFVTIKNGEIKVKTVLKTWESKLTNVKIRTYDFTIDDSYMLFKKVNLIFINQSTSISDIQFSNLREIEQYILDNCTMNQGEKKAYLKLSLSIDIKQAKRIIFFSIVNICFLFFCSVLLILKSNFGMMQFLIQMCILILLILLMIKTINSIKFLIHNT